MTHDVFISYSSPDTVAARTVCAALEQHGLKCWIAPRNQFVGMPFGQQITEAIKSAKAMVLIFSGSVNNSNAVQNEVYLALKESKAIIPVKIEDVEFNAELRYHIQRLHWLKAFPPPIEVHMDELAAAVASRLSIRSDAPAYQSTEPGAGATTKIAGPRCRWTARNGLHSY